MGKKKTDNEKVAEFIAANPGANKAAIVEGTGVKGIILHNILKKMVNAEELTESGTGKEATYTTVEPTAKQPQVETSKDADNVEEGEQRRVSTGRDTTKFKYNGMDNLGKGPLVREVVRKYVEDNKPTIKQLKEVFPDELLKRFGVFQEEDQARSIQGSRDRYFWKPEHQISVRGKVIVVCSQWTSETLKVFIKHCKTIGISIKH